MSYDYIPQTDYTKSRSERRRALKERWESKLKPARGPNRKMRRSGKSEYKLWSEA